MQQNQKQPSAGGMLVSCLALLNAAVLEQGFVYHPRWYAALVVSLPLMLASVLLLKRQQW